MMIFVEATGPPAAAPSRPTTKKKTTRAVAGVLQCARTATPLQHPRICPNFLLLAPVALRHFRPLFSATNPATLGGMAGARWAAATTPRSCRDHVAPSHR